MQFTFNAQKAAQAGAYLLKLHGGDMDKYKWIKMLYWSDRESLAKWCEPITGDRAVSAPFGQILEKVYDLTKQGCYQTLKASYWGKYISDSDKEANRIILKDDPGTDELSRSELAILNATYLKFKDFNFAKLKKFFSELEEHEDVVGTSKPLDIQKILKAVGKTDDEIRKAEKEQQSMRIADMLLG